MKTDVDVMKDFATTPDTNKTTENVSQEYVHSNDNMSFFYLIACVTGVFLLLLICVIVMLIRNRQYKRQPHGLFLPDFADRIPYCKSAPLSRSSSPSREKRRSCPHVYGAFGDAIVRSSTLDNLPSLETEMVQPDTAAEKSKSLSTLQHHPHTVGMHPQIPLIGAEEHHAYTDATVCEYPHGLLWFKTSFDQKSNKLVVTLIKVSGLKGRSQNENWRDPFVKTFLLPDENVCHISRVVKKTLNPVFNETFDFQVSQDEFAKRSLRFSVYDVDKRRLRHTLGHVVAPLKDNDVMSSETIARPLDVGIHHGPCAGELNISLSYLPHMERLKIVILRARNIRPSPSPDTAYYVRLHLHYGNKVVKIKQTLTQLAVPEVSFNESFSFSTSNKSIENFYFIVTLVQTHRTSLSSDIDLGQVVLGSFMFARGEGLIHWQEMIAKSRSAVTNWHQLTLPV